MYIALDSEGRRQPPIKGGRGTCPRCDAEVIAKCGDQKIHHWAHAKGKTDCDPWAEPETVWHREWQARADPDWCEVVMGEHREHRADVRRPSDGLVIELQHSPISDDEIREREAFYGNMWWVFDTQPWRFRAKLLPDGTAKYRWITRRRTLEAAARPIYLDLGGPLLLVKGYGPQGCGQGFGELLSRSDFIRLADLRPLSDDELRKTSHYTVTEKYGGDVVFARSLDSLRTWNSVDGTAVHYDLAGRSTTVQIPEVPLVSYRGRG